MKQANQAKAGDGVLQTTKTIQITRPIAQSTIPRNNITNEPPSPDTNGENKALKVYVESPDCINNGARAEVFLTSEI